jgi:hypothetical protein
MDIPQLTWCLRITKSEGLALKMVQDNEFQRIGCFSIDENKTEWFDDVKPQTITVL